MSRGDLYAGDLQSVEDLKRAVRRIVARINEIEATTIHSGVGGLAVTPLGTSARTAVIASNEITATRNFHRLESETGSSDDLTTINGGDVGQLLLLQARSGHTITVRDGAKINLAGAADFVMANSGADKLCLIRGSSSWDEVSRSTNA